MERVKKISETYPIFKQIQKATNGQVKPEYSFAALAVLIFCSLFCRTLAGAITNSFALLLIISPATSTIVSKATPDISSTKHILSYLLTFALVTAVESVLCFIPSRVPFFYHAKFLFFYYLSVRRTQLTDYINSSVYVPANESIRKINQIDVKAALKVGQTAAADAVKTVKETKESFLAKEE